MCVKKLFVIVFCCVLASLSALSVNESFIEACRAGDLGEARRLLDEGASIEARDGSDHQTAIVWAAGKGHLAVVKMLVERGADINAQDDKGWTALSESSYDGHTEVVELLLKLKASTLPSTSWLDSKEHGNAVFWCVESSFNTYQQKIEIVKLLLKNNAEPEGVNAKNLDTLGIAKARNYKEIVEMLEKFAKERLKKLNEYGLLEGIKARDLKKVKEFLAKKVNPNLLLPNGESILNRAVAMQNLEIVRLLLENGANPSTQNALGTSALMEAMKYNNLPIIKLLISAGANVNQKDNSGKDALFYAVQNKDTNVIAAVLNAGVNVHSTDNSGETALLYACRIGNFPAVKFLVNRGAQLSATDLSGNTALHLAAQKGRLDLVRFILKDSSIDACATDNNDHNALYYAQKSGNAQVIKLLKQATEENEDEVTSDNEISNNKDREEAKNEAPSIDE